eukprot:Gb_37624 [translate_table: standard]
MDESIMKASTFTNIAVKTVGFLGFHSTGRGMGSSLSTAALATKPKEWPERKSENKDACNDVVTNGIFDILHQPGIYVDSITFASLLHECINVKSLIYGKLVHAHMIRTGVYPGIFLQNNLVNMYAKSGCVLDARKVFDRMPERSLVTWTGMIAGYAQNGYSKEAICVFCQMQRAGRESNHFTFSSVLQACASLADVENGKQVHAQVVKTGFECNVFAGSALLDMYCKCGFMEHARALFDKMPKKDVVSWTAMITGYAQNQQDEEALKVFSEMQWAGMKPNQFTFASVVGVCATLAALDQGKEVHAYVIKTGFESDVCVGSILTDMYAKCGHIGEALKLFDKMPNRDMISWTATIGAYAQNGCANEALELFCEMLRTGVKPNQYTFASVFMACASIAALQHGRQFHVHVIKMVFDLDIFVGSALVDMYAKCGSIADACHMFQKIPTPNVVSWNSMIAGYAQHGHSKEALQLFERMQVAGTKPNHITFVAVLSACSHVGLVDEGRQYFDSMSRKFGITPSIKHYACMVDLLSRAGRLEEAEDLINKMPFEPDSVIWRGILGGCRLHGNMELGKQAAESLIAAEPHNSATYVLLSNIYASAGMWDDVKKVRQMMKDRGVKKETGYSWIEIKNKVHAFIAGDRSHPQTEKIYAKLEQLTGQIRETGYAPDTNFVLHDVEKEQKELFLCYHSEKLAIAFGLISAPHLTAIRVIKNLRMSAAQTPASLLFSGSVSIEIISCRYECIRISFSNPQKLGAMEIKAEQSFESTIRRATPLGSLHRALQRSHIIGYLWPSMIIQQSVRRGTIVGVDLRPPRQAPVDFIVVDNK